MFILDRKEAVIVITGRPLSLQVHSRLPRNGDPSYGQVGRPAMRFHVRALSFPL